MLSQDEAQLLDGVEWIGGSVLGALISEQRSACPLCSRTLTLADPVMEWFRSPKDGSPFPAAVHRRCARELELAAGRAVTPVIDAVVDSMSLARGAQVGASAVAREALHAALTGKSWCPQVDELERAAASAREEADWLERKVRDIVPSSMPAIPPIEGSVEAAVAAGIEVLAERGSPDLEPADGVVAAGDLTVAEIVDENRRFAADSQALAAADPGAAQDA